jgi:hypothetical protein
LTDAEFDGSCHRISNFNRDFRAILAWFEGKRKRLYRAFSGEVDTGWREENASEQNSRASVLIPSEPEL